MKWVKDPKIEAKLRALNIEFTVETIKIADIDLEASLDRQVRLGKKLNDDVVSAYMMGMAAPDAAWPMVIVNKVKKSIFLWSGNHRTHAALMNDMTTVDAYVVNIVDPVTQDLVPRIVNAMESAIGQTKEESLIHAEHMIKVHGMEIKDAVIAFSLPQHVIVQHLRTSQITNELSSQGVQVNGIAKHILIKMAPIDNTNVRREAAKFIKKNSIVGDEAGRFLDDVKRPSTEQDALKEIKRWEGVLEARKSKGKRPIRTKNRSRFLKILSNFHSFLRNVNTPSQLQLEHGEEAQVAMWWHESETKMNSLIGKAAK